MKNQIPAVEGQTIGLDLGDRRHHACVLNAAGAIVAEEAIANTREVLTAFCARYPGATIIMETGTHSPWVSRLVAALGHPVIVANARKLRAISQSHTKSDTEDARTLARLGRADPKHFAHARAVGPYLGLVPRRERREPRAPNPPQQKGEPFSNSLSTRLLMEGARANDHSRHASCYRISFEMNPPNENRVEARVAPAVVVAHL